MTYMPGFSGWRDNEVADALAAERAEEEADRNREDQKLGKDDDR